jgi:hypothetical protein
MARKTATPKTYATDPAFLALDSGTRYDAVMATAGNALREFPQEDGGTVELAYAEVAGREYRVVVAWDAEHGAYEVLDTFTPES